jgi:hypothetical protein
VDIPSTHWNQEIHGWQSYVPYWEKSLRASIEAQPDPAKRFEAWLSHLARGESGKPGIRLIFIEQPYLAWAELVEQLVATKEKELRQTIAYEIANPDEH